MLRNSERSTYRRCRQKWKWSYLDQREPKGRRGALSFGSLTHAALEIYYPPGAKRGPHPAEAFADMFDKQVDEFEQWDEEGNRIPARDLGITMLTEYVNKYGKDTFLEVVAPEQTYAIDVLDKQGNYLVTMVGTFDALAYNLKTERYVLLEHKTAKSIEEVQINSNYGEQGLIYYWAAELTLHHSGALPADEHVDGVLFNFLRKAVPDQRPRNSEGHYLNKPKKDALVAACKQEGLKTAGTMEALIERLLGIGWTPAKVARLGEVSKIQPSPLFDRQELLFGHHELESINRRIRAEAWEMGQVRKGKAPIYKNPTKDCSWDCPFYNACELHEMGQDYEAILDMDFKPWNPYSDHELEMERRG